MRAANLAIFGLFALACGEAPAPVDAGMDAGAFDAGPPQPSAVLFDPGALGATDSFFDLPFPSDLRTDAEGHPDLTGFPRARGLVADAIALVEGERPGFSPITPVYFRFTEPLDEASLPAGPADVALESSSILLLDVDPASPEQGRRLPAYVSFQANASTFFASNTLVVRTVPGVHMHPGRRYAVVVRDGLMGADGTPVGRSDAFEALKAGGSGALATHYAALFDELEGLGIPRAEVAVATTFTTSDPVTDMDRARAWLHTQPVPSPISWETLAVSPREVHVAGDFETYELMEGAPPFMEFGSGLIRFDAAGAPMSVRRTPVRFAISIPVGVAAPPEGYPIVLYGHGTGGDERTHLRDEGHELAAEGIAMIGFEAALHGDRNPAGFEFESLVVANPIAAREVVRQTVIDMMVLLRMLEAGVLEVPAVYVSGATAPVIFDASPVLYMGHSQGSQEAGVLLGVEPTIDAAFLSAGGGGGLLTLVERDLTPGNPIACIVGGLIGEPDCAVMDENHPALALVIQPLLDPADPLVFAHRFLRERPDGWAPTHIAMTEGLEDTDTPPPAIEALAASIGLPIVEPVAQMTDPFLLLGAPTVTAPVRENLTTPGGASVTGGLMQWPMEGHFAIYRNADALNRYVRFFDTMIADGAPTIVGP